MADFNAMYLKLFNAMTNAINILQAAQIETEEMFGDHEPTIIQLVTPDENDCDGDNDA